MSAKEGPLTRPPVELAEEVMELLGKGTLLEGLIAMGSVVAVLRAVLEARGVSRGDPMLDALVAIDAAFRAGLGMSESEPGEAR